MGKKTPRRLIDWTIRDEYEGYYTVLRYWKENFGFKVALEQHRHEMKTLKSINASAKVVDAHWNAFKSFCNK